MVLQAVAWASQLWTGALANWPPQREATGTGGGLTTFPKQAVADQSHGLRHQSQSLLLTVRVAHTDLKRGPRAEEPPGETWHPAETSTSHG